MLHCEALWLGGMDSAPFLAPLRAIFDQARQRRARVYIDELGYWLWRLGVPVDGVDPEHPRGLQMAGRWRQAAQAWSRIGCPLEEGQALLQGDAAAVQQAIGIFQNLQARAYVERARVCASV